MKLAHKDFKFIVDFSNGNCPVIVIENSKFFRQYVSEMYEQYSGVDGHFVMSLNWEPIPISKNIFMVTDVFNMTLNGRKQINMLIKKLEEISLSEYFIQKTLEAKRSLEDWLYTLEEEIPLPLMHDEEICIANLIKASGIQFEGENLPVPEKLDAFIKICAEFFGIKLLVFVGLHTCLEKEELEQLYKTAAYQEVAVLDFERIEPDIILPNEKLYIIDKDGCEIYTD
ncbi:MAG: type II-A CRISPR-associated protein Csn2 [Eubacteriales bacterium]|nr:type II-A CRISPR-associated protein Csn2 [Eubacteriales bacterium]